MNENVFQLRHMNHIAVSVTWSFQNKVEIKAKLFTR